MEALELPADAHSVSLALAFVREAAVHVADPFAAMLSTSELVANVVRHAPRVCSERCFTDHCATRGGRRLGSR